jgi:beta-mannosidase
MLKKVILNNDWSFSLSKNYNSSDVLIDKRLISFIQFPATVPGTIHTDLLNNKIIDDPFYSDNELRMDWIPECDWLYQTIFDFNGDIKNKVDLVFEGLDTISEIYLNNIRLGGTDNMFVQYQYNVKNILKAKGNKLKVLFKSPTRFAADEENKYGKLPVALNSTRVYIRKAQYSFGWDWGPSFPTSGIWRNVYLEEWVDAKIESVTFKTISINKKTAEVEANIDVSKFDKKNISMAVSLSNGDIVYEQKIPLTSSSKNKISFKIKAPKLWWPNGEGEQNLYLLKVKLVKENIVVDEIQKNVGIRTIELVLKEKNKSTFKFRVNNKDIYSKGVNWIPADSFLPRETKKKYRDLLMLAKQANMNIVRVWGGGIYEDDEFYNLCDELGLLVWQDFMFACGSYPENDNFIANVREEVIQNVLRLQHHACLAIWCGNNENEWIWYQVQKTSYKKMPGYNIYHKIIPAILRKIDPSHPYWSSSPFGNDEDPNSFESGNTHQWNIWSRWIDYTEVVNDKSLFVTEFGFQSPANKDTIEKYLPIKNRNVSDNIFEHHNKQIEGPERIIKFLNTHLPIKTEWNDYLYLAQLNQAFALKTCLEHWRTNSRTNGSIIWQLNDCWPVSSWSIVDSDIRPKLSYHFVKNSFAPELIYFTNDGTRIKINLLNQNHLSINGKLRIAIIDSNTGKILSEQNLKVNIKGKATAEINSILLKELPDNNNWILTAILFDESDNLVCKNYYTLKPWKHITLAKPQLKIEVVNKKDSTYLLIKSKNPVFFIDIYYPHLTFSDHGFFILPGEQIKLKVIGNQITALNVKDIKIFSLNSYLHH